MRQQFSLSPTEISSAPGSAAQEKAEKEAEKAEPAKKAEYRESADKLGRRDMKISHAVVEENDEIYLKKNNCSEK